MKRSIIFICGLCAIGGTTFAGPRSSANYSIPADSTGAAGAHCQSANYSVNGNAIGEFGAGQTAIVTSGSYANKSGLVGELYEIVALAITASSNNLNETASRQLNAAPLADDSTTLAALDPSTVSWSIVSGPINSISLSGVATAGNVYQDTAASAGGAAQSLSGQLNLTILNVTNDDFGAYANDQIDDDWQVQYFGEPPNSLAGPNADPDGDSQNNLFEFTAGLIPNDPTSRFRLRIEPVTAQPNQRRIIFSPRLTDRTYNPQFRTHLLLGAWNPLTGTTQSDNGDARTVTDPNALDPAKFYRVQITRP